MMHARDFTAHVVGPTVQHLSVWAHFKVHDGPSLQPHRDLTAVRTAADDLFPQRCFPFRFFLPPRQHHENPFRVHLGVAGVVGQRHDAQRAFLPREPAVLDFFDVVADLQHQRGIDKTDHDVRVVLVVGGGADRPHLRRHPWQRGSFGEIIHGQPVPQHPQGRTVPSATQGVHLRGPFLAQIHHGHVQHRRGRIHGFHGF
jgi:hypothetical protein